MKNTWVVHLATTILLIFCLFCPEAPASALDFSVDGSQDRLARRTTVPAPANVMATDGTYTSKVLVKWNAVLGATSYKVYRGDRVTAQKISMGSTTSRSFTDTSATPGKTYYYWVVAYSGKVYSEYSAYDVGWRRLDVPTNVLATNGTNYYVQLTWSSVNGATSYRVYKAVSVTGPKTLVGTSTETKFTDLKAKYGMTYYYWIKACRSLRCSLHSSYDTGWVKKLLPPTDVVASNGTYSDRVWVEWNYTDGMPSYMVYRSTSMSGAKILLGKEPILKDWIDKTATTNTHYYYWVKAYVGANISGFSNYDEGWKAP